MRVLVIEDDVEIRHLATLILNEGGHEVLTAEHGQQAIEVLANCAPPSLILLDLMMPKMDGWEFRCWQLQQARLADIPVVVFSATVTDVSVESLQAAGYLRKPFDCDQLLGAVVRFAEQDEVAAKTTAP